MSKAYLKSLALFVAGALLLFSRLSISGQGFTCQDFNQLTKGEKKQYLSGYVLGAAMELKYLKSNFHNEIRKNEYLSGYVDEKYDLINIAVAYPSEFRKKVEYACNIENFKGSGMFDALPSILRMMRETGSYPVWGM